MWWLLLGAVLALHWPLCYQFTAKPTISSMPDCPAVLPNSLELQLCRLEYCQSLAQSSNMEECA